MRSRIITLSLTLVVLVTGFLLIPVRSYAAQAKNLTKEVMSGTGGSDPSSAVPDSPELQFVSPDKKREVQIKLGDEFKAYILAGASPFKELNGQPIPGDYRAMFGLHIPLK
jgi:hypothetical protein